MKSLDCVGIDATRADCGKADFHPCPTGVIIHGVAEPSGDEANKAIQASILAAQARFEAVVRERDALRAALEDIAARSPAFLASMPPKDYAADRAARILAQLDSGELRKPSE
jgi:hypothetical protein